MHSDSRAFEFSGIQVIFFDAVGTLIRLPRGVGFHYCEVAERHGWTIDEEVLAAKFRETWKTMPARAVTNAPRVEDDKPWWRELVERVLARCGIAATSRAREAYFEDLYLEFTRPGVWSLFPEVSEVLTQLHGRFRLGIISNFDGRLRMVLQGLGIDKFFDCMAISSEAGADKPSLQIFDYALQLAGCLAPAALHVGDDPELDWRGGADAGFRVFPLDRPQRTLRNLSASLLS